MAAALGLACRQDPPLLLLVFLLYFASPTSVLGGLLCMHPAPFLSLMLPAVRGSQSWGVSHSLWDTFLSSLVARFSPEVVWGAWSSHFYGSYDSLHQPPSWFQFISFPFCCHLPTKKSGVAIKPASNLTPTKAQERIWPQVSQEGDWSVYQKQELSALTQKTALCLEAGWKAGRPCDVFAPPEPAWMVARLW